MVVLIMTPCFINCSKHQKPENLIITYQNVFNQHNVDSLMVLYSDDIKFSIPNMRMNISGIEAMRGIAEYDSVLQTMMKISNISVKADTVFCSLQEKNEWLITVGISSANYPNTKILFHENKITYFETNLSDSSLKEFGYVMGSLIPWARENYPIELDAIIPESGFKFDTENGIRFLELSKKWKESTINIGK